MTRVERPTTLWFSRADQLVSRMQEIWRDPVVYFDVRATEQT